MGFVAPSKTATSGITEIRLRLHSTDDDECLVIFYWNGAAVLEAHNGVTVQGIKYKGAYAGRILPARFQQLTRLLLNAKFFQLNEVYSSSGYGIDEIDMVRSGKRKRIMLWSGAGPAALKQALAAVRGEVGRVKWKFLNKLKPLPRPTARVEVAEGPLLDENGHFASGIRGVAMAGPIRPVERIGDPPNERPLARAVITIQPDGGGKEIVRKRADEKGRFEIALPPGKYLLVPLGPRASDEAPPEEPQTDDLKGDAAMLPRGTPQTVVVAEGKFTEVTVDYDTGIR
jgi:hypothetical protein